MDLLLELVGYLTALEPKLATSLDHGSHFLAQLTNQLLLTLYACVCGPNMQNVQALLHSKLFEVVNRLHAKLWYHHANNHINGDVLVLKDSLLRLLQCCMEALQVSLVLLGAIEQHSTPIAGKRHAMGEEVLGGN